jgi:hypothetical protein
VGCLHRPRHLDLADAVLRFLGSSDPVTIKAVRSACGRRNRAPNSRSALQYRS